MDNGADSYRRFVGGDDGGLVEIIRDYKDGLILFLNRYVNNIHAAEELAEDTFFKIAVKKPRFAARASFKTWLYTIGRNTAVNYLKHSKKTLDIPIEATEGNSDEYDLERAYIREEQKMIVHRALSKINAEYSRVLYLKFFEDMDNGQIAAVLKKGRRQVENMLYQAKKALKAELDKEGFHYEGL